MLAEEQAVIRRGPGIRKEVEAAFGFGGETEGTLVLTDRRLVYIHEGREQQESVRIGLMSAKRLRFSDVQALNSMTLGSGSVEIPLSRIVGVAGHHEEATAPKLEVSWTGKDGEGMRTEFVQQVTGGSRRKNLNDWAKVIQRLKAGQIKLARLPPHPGAETLEGRILGVLGDMQQKGVFTIESEVEARYKLELDPDDVGSACARLSTSGLVRKFSPPGEDESYSLVSPLGEDDLTA